MALEDTGQVEVEAAPMTAPRAPSEERRVELMTRMMSNERSPDPSNETTRLSNTDYRMDHNLYYVSTTLLPPPGLSSRQLQARLWG